MLNWLGLLKSLQGRTDQFVPMVEELWGRMKTGGFSTVLREKVLRFNGGLFEDGSDAAIDRLDALLGAASAPENVVPLRKSKGL